LPTAPLFFCLPFPVLSVFFITVPLVPRSRSVLGPNTPCLGVRRPCFSRADLCSFFLLFFSSFCFPALHRSFPSSFFFYIISPSLAFLSGSLPVITFSMQNISLSPFGGFLLRLPRPVSPFCPSPSWPICLTLLS